MVCQWTWGLWASDQASAKAANRRIAALIHRPQWRTGTALIGRGRFRFPGATEAGDAMLLIGQPLLTWAE